MPDSGWQPAVDNLQSQINSLNSQISVLSGQEGSQTAQIALLMSEVSALQTEVSTIQQKVAQGNLLADLSGVSASNAFGAPALLSLNGNSILQMPASANIDGKPFRISVLARVSHDGLGGSIGGGTSFGGTLLLGSSLQSPTLGTSSYLESNSRQTGLFSGLFFSEIDFMWDSVSQKLFVLERNEFSQRTSLGFVSGLGTSAGGTQDGFNVSSQSALQFVFSAQWNNTSNPATVILSQFKLSLI